MLREVEPEIGDRAVLHMSMIETPGLVHETTARMETGGWKITRTPGKTTVLRTAQSLSVLHHHPASVA